MALKIALVLVLLHMGGYSGGQCQQLNTKTGGQCPPSSKPDLPTLTKELIEGLEQLKITSLHVLEEQVRYRANVERNVQDLRESLEDVKSKQLKLKQDIRGILDCKKNTSNKGPHLDCRAAYQQGRTHSGIYTVQPDSGPPFDVYCDMETDGGGWTVFQHRQDGSQDFYLYWDDYERGFGNLSGEFWLGLSKIHRLTASAELSTELRVDLEDFSNNTAYAKYTAFLVGDSASNYTMTVSGYSGTASDSFSQDSGQQFTTRDRDNDIFIQNCAQARRGAWWYRACTFANLNGYYFPSLGNTVSWWHWKLTWERLKFTEMKLRHA